MLKLKQDEPTSRFWTLHNEAGEIDGWLCQCPGGGWLDTAETLRLTDSETPPGRPLSAVLIDEGHEGYVEMERTTMWTF